MEPSIPAPTSAQPQSYVTITAGPIPNPNPTAHTVSPMDYMDSDVQTPINDKVMTLTDERQVRNSLASQQIKSNKCRTKEVTPVADTPATAGLPNFKEKKVSANVDGPTGAPNGALALNTTSTINDSWPTITDANSGTACSHQAVSLQCIGAPSADATAAPQVSNAQLGTPRPLLLNIPTDLADTLMNIPEDGPKIFGLEAGKLHDCTHQESLDIFHSHPGEKVALFPLGRNPVTQTPWC
ncbi:hypothetical protein M422DRAFT_275737 [Sphaerobolus stellatus SS14]|uniref:Uncharacterized protein n=1 Tax=Sphaerobolus stellatus (strain SS14) TaxID=990650 RepID=A0A0C9TP05_SPHS4|nr:hypothetical protein M422DRAFT_275737 [Sphaerobolus stellatus SS14]